MKKRRIAAELRRTLSMAFPGNQMLLQVALGWIGADSKGGAACAVCGRTLVIAGTAGAERNPRGAVIVTDARPGSRRDAICEPCARAVSAAFSPRDPMRPSWELVHAEIERALALGRDEEALIEIRRWLARHPVPIGKGSCLFCSSETDIAGGGRAALCYRCAREAEIGFDDYAAARAQDRMLRCPRCGSVDAAENGGVYEFARMECDSCGLVEMCDAYQIETWYRNV